jgi:hypothetical protein
MEGCEVTLCMECANVGYWVECKIQQATIYAGKFATYANSE